MIQQLLTCPPGVSLNMCTVQKLDNTSLFRTEGECLTGILDAPIIPAVLKVAG